MIQSLVQPSESLTAAWSKLSLMPLADALRDVSQGGMGLHGVLELLRKASGGNVQVLLSWFDEIRAGRGAFALMNNEGATYIRVLKGMDEASKGQGATQKAFQEQMKSTSMQFKLMMNDFKAIGLEIGDALQPIADAAISISRIFLGAWAQIPQPVKELIAYLGALSSALSIVVGILGVLAAKWLLSVGAMMLLSRGLQALGSMVFAQGAQWEMLGLRISSVGDKIKATSFSQFIVSGLTTPIKLAGQAFDFLGQQVSKAHPTLGRFGIALQQVGSGMQSAAQNAMMFARALPILAVGLLAVLGDMTRSQQAADAWVESFTTNIDADSFQGLTKGIDTIRKNVNASKKQMDTWDFHGVHVLTTDFGEMKNNLKATEMGLRGVGSALTSMVGLGHAFGDPFGDATKALKAQQALAKYTERLANLSRVANEVLRIKLYVDPNFATEYANMSAQQRMKSFEGRIDLVAKAARRLGFTTQDLGSLSSAQYAKITKAVDEMASHSGVSTAALTLHGEQAVEAAKKQEKQIAKFITEIDQAFMKGFDIAGAVTEKGAAGQQQLRDFLFTYNHMAQEFVDDMATLMRRGLSPEILMQFAQAGPEASRNAIKAMLDDTSGQLIQFANETVAHLTDLRIRLERESNIIARAAMNPFAAADVEAGLKLGDVAQFLGIHATPERVAAAMGITPEAATRIANEFGLTLGIGFQTTIGDQVTKLGPVFAQHMEEAIVKAHITDSQATEIFKAYRTGGVSAATDVIEKMNLAAEPRQVLIDLVGYLETIAGLQQVDKKADDTGKKNPKVKVGADTDEAEGKLSHVQESINRINGLKAILGVEVQVSNAAIIDQHPEIFSFMGTNVAKGGVMNGGGVQTFAKGGERHVAQLAKGGTWRLWAEPETGGEAYIPLHHGRPTPRDLAILDRVATMFGYQVRPAAAGYFDVRPGTVHGTGGTIVNLHTTIQVQGHIYGDAHLQRTMSNAIDVREREVAMQVRRAKVGV